MPGSPAPTKSYVALLRGINVGGKNIIPMAALRRSFEELGFGSVRTLIASGNVLFRAARTSSRALEVLLDDALSARHSHDAKVVVRSLAEYERMTSAMPDRWGTDRGRRYYVMFLRRSIDRPAVLGELEVNEAVEELRYVPGALLWSARLDGLTKSRTKKVMTLGIYREMTVRNLQTVRKIHAALRALSSSRDGSTCFG